MIELANRLRDRAEVTRKEILAGLSGAVDATEAGARLEAWLGELPDDPVSA